MDSKNLARTLLSPSTENPKVQTFADKLLLRIFNYPSLMTQLNKVNIIGENVELEFNMLPERVIPDLLRLIAVGKVQVLEYDGDNGHHFHGFKIDLAEVLDEID